MKYVEDAFASYATSCIPEDAGEHQRRETQEAFYAGAMMTVLGIQKALVALDAEAAEAAIHSIIQECIDYSGKVVDGLKAELKRRG